MKIVIDSAIPYIHGVWEPHAEVVYLSGDQISAEDVRNADALIVRTRTRCNEALLAGSSVRVVATATIGTDHIDLAWCAANGIRVESAAGCNARGVLQWVSAALLEVCRRREWRPQDLTLGVVGVGHVGGLVAEYAEQWGFRVLRCDPPRSLREGPEGFYSLGEILPQCDILTIHTPFTRTGDHPTAGLIDAEALALMPSHAVVLNSARGGIVDEQALVASGHDFGLDTWMGEPALNPQALHRALVATPHIAGYSRQGKATATRMACEAVGRALGIAVDFHSPIEPTNIRPITWEQLQAEMPQHFDIAAESAALKASPENFEQLRNNYAYRQEFF